MFVKDGAIINKSTRKEPLDFWKRGWDRERERSKACSYTWSWRGKKKKKGKKQMKGSSCTGRNICDWDLGSIFSIRRFVVGKVSVRAGEAPVTHLHVAMPGLCYEVLDEIKPSSSQIKQKHMNHLIRSMLSMICWISSNNIYFSITIGFVISLLFK